MQHLVRRDVVQHETDGLGGVQPGWHRHQFTLRQADELCVRPVYRQRGNDLAWFDSRDTVAEPIHMRIQVMINGDKTLAQRINTGVVENNVTARPT